MGRPSWQRGKPECLSRGPRPLRKVDGASPLGYGLRNSFQTMDKQFFESLSTHHGITVEVAKKIYLDICKEMASKLMANEKQSCPYFVIKPVTRPEKQKTMEDGTQKQLESRHFGRMMVKGVASTHR
jgi:hypothetical protein